MRLHAVKDETPALTSDELKARGDELVTVARKSALEAIRKSMLPEFVERGISLTPARIRLWRYQAQAARDEWQNVVAACDELLIEIEKTRAANGGTR